MSLSVRFARALSIIGIAAVGLVAAHELDYRLIVPDPQHRHDLLLRTGHGYLSRVVFIALAVGLISLVASLVVGAARGRGHGLRSSTRTTVVFLAIVQSGGFVTLEAVERAIVGSPPDDRLVLVTLAGVAVQVVAATVGGLLLRLFERAGEVIAAIVRRDVPAAERSAVDPVPPPAPHRESRAADRFWIRGPPVVERT